MKKGTRIIELIFCIMIIANAIYAVEVNIYDEEIDIEENLEEQAMGDKDKYEFVKNSDGVNTVTLLKYKHTAVINYIPDSLDNEYFVTRLGDGLFEGSTYVRLAGIQDGILTLGTGVFKNCSKLTQASIGTGIKVISDETFYNNTSLKTVVKGKNVTEVGDRAFYNCFALETISINSNLERIGEQAFYNCRALSLSSLSSNLKEIGSQAFYNCEKFEKEVLNIPKSVESIGSEAFYNTSIKYFKFLDDDLPVLGNNALNGTLLLPVGWKDKNNNSTKGYENYNIIEMLFGDVNNDTYINSTDAAMILDMYKNATAPSDELEFYKIDMNSDGVLNSTDAAMILDIFKNK